MAGKVCSDDDKFGQIGFQRRPNHQNVAIVRCEADILPSVADHPYVWPPMEEYLGNVVLKSWIFFGNWF
jgi:hypothetical protein